MRAVRNLSRQKFKFTKNEQTFRNPQAIYTVLRTPERDKGPALFRHLGTSLFRCLTPNSARINKQRNGRLDPNLTLLHAVAS